MASAKSCKGGRCLSITCSPTICSEFHFISSICLKHFIKFWIYKWISIVFCFHKYFILFHKLLNRIQDACEKFNGIFGIRSGKEVCCNKKCPQCGGKNCAKWKDDMGKKLGSNQCCKWKIIKRGKKCGSDGGKAPCML